jgi:hypothetical protein
MVVSFQRRDWEGSLGKAGKFIEAVLKALWTSTGNQAPAGRAFKADRIITDLTNLPQGPYHDSTRITIPRASRFIYEVASNRGGRHDPGEVNPNEMDATVAVTVSSWIVAEMIRISSRGTVGLDRAGGMVASLVQKKYPLVEYVDGRTYFHGRKKSAPDLLLLALAEVYPGRLSVSDLLATAVRHGFTLANARKGLSRIRRYVDDDGEGGLRSLVTGLERAEQVRQDISGSERRR